MARHVTPVMGAQRAVGKGEPLPLMKNDQVINGS